MLLYKFTCGTFVRPNDTFKSSLMNKWVSLSSQTNYLHPMQIMPLQLTSIVMNLNMKPVLTTFKLLAILTTNSTLD